MTDNADISPEPDRSSPRRRWRWRHWLALFLLVLGLSFAGAMMWLDTSSGHRFVVRQITGLEPENGLKIEVGRIDGSIYNKAVLHDLRLSDPKGVFFSAEVVRLEWWPLAWLSNRLEIDTLRIPTARLHRMPEFLKTESTGKILPDFDIRVMRLKLDRLAVDAAVTGRAEIFSLTGDADVRSGKAMVDLAARAINGEDRLLLALDSRPDDNRFDIDLTVNAPADGLLAKLSGLKQDANIRLDGDGDWTKWDGKLIATLDGNSAAGFDIELRKGAYRIEGNVSGSAIAEKGALARLASPQLSVVADGTFKDLLLSGHLAAKSEAIVVDLKGGVHLGGHGYDNLIVDVSLPKPQALLRNFDARGLVARLRLNGPFETARFEYLLRADQLRFGSTILCDVHAAGDGRSAGGDKPTFIPLNLSAKRIEGQGDIVASILNNASIIGTLQKQGSMITSAPLRLRSDKVNGTVVAQFNLTSGRYDIALAGDIRGIVIPGLGVVDVNSRVQAVPDARGAFSVRGRVAAVMRRLDNAFLRTVGGGLPRIESDIALGSDGRLRLDNLLVNAPALTLRGNGVRNPDGTVRLVGSGTHRDYGPLKLVLTGALDRPKVDLLLDRPFDPAGLKGVHVELDPDPIGYRFHATGQSTLGPFDAVGMIEMPPGGATVIAIERLKVNGSEAEGRLTVQEGGLVGRLLFSGDTHGSVDLSVAGGVQKIDASLRLDRAHFGGEAPIDILRGRLNAKVSLDPGGTSVNASFTGRGIQVGRFRLNRINAQANLVDGAGKVRAKVVGQQGRAFDLQIDADIAPDDIGVSLAGRLDGQPISTNRRAHIRRIDGGWALDPVTVRYAGGYARIKTASFGSATRLDVDLSRLPLTLLDLSNADLGLAGSASGTISFAQNRGGLPTGGASLRILKLSRSGATRTSAPIDVGLNAQLQSDRLALRMIMEQDGKTVGKAQALMTPLGSGSLIDRLRAAPLRAQLRYVGPADAVWRMTRIEIIDLTGEVAVAADVRGTGADPVINGTLVTKNAALESPITGMRLSAVKSRARFDGSKLTFSEMAGKTANGGSVSGSGSFDFSLGVGVGIDLAFQADNAELLSRDDIGATVNGPIRITSNGNGGLIAGDFDVVRSSFTLGRAAAVAEIPELEIIEKNGSDNDFEPIDRGADWQLDIKANARNRLMVRGMGLSSEWRMDLDVGGSVTNPVITGRADLVRGSYDFAGRRFDLTAGSLRFDGSVPADPVLDISAEATVSDLDATIRITGRSSAPEISFTSVPALPQDEVLSRILFGSSITSLSAPEALQLAAAVASLQGGGGGGLDPINAVRKAAGLDRLRILPADTTTGRGTAIGAGKYLTRKTYVELISDGQGYSATRVEYQVTRWLSLLSSISTLGRASATVRVSKDY